MGQHRSSEGGGNRGVSKGPILALALVLFVALGAIGWYALRDQIDREGATAAASCVEGDTTVSVAADPDLEPALSAIATRFNDTEPVVRDHCVRIVVRSVESKAALDGLAGTWDPALLGAQPALWIPQSTAWTAELAATNAPRISGDPKSIATSPIVLVVPTVARQKLVDAAIGWWDVVRLQSGAGSLDALGLAGWGGLRLALPPGADATALAIQAVAAAAAGAPNTPAAAGAPNTPAAAGAQGPPITADQVRSPAVVQAISALAIDAPKEPPTSTDKTLRALADQQDPAAAAFHTVVATEQQAFSAAGDRGKIASVVLGGATPVADFPTTRIAAPWVDETLSRSAAEFVDYLGEPEQSATLANAGFRVEGTPAPSIPVVDFAALGATLQLAPTGISDALAEVLANPAVGQQTTILLDISASMGITEDGGTRLRNATTALKQRLDGMPGSSNVGLWTFSRDLDESRPYAINVPTGSLSEGGFPAGDRRQAIENALTTIVERTDSFTYRSVVAAYKSAVEGFSPGRSNSVLLVTDGPNEDSSMTSASLFATIAAAYDPARPVRVDVISISPHSDLENLRSLVQQNGGTIAELQTSSGPELGAALQSVLQ